MSHTCLPSCSVVGSMVSPIYVSRLTATWWLYISWTSYLVTCFAQHAVDSKMNSDVKKQLLWHMYCWTWFRRAMVSIHVKLVPLNTRFLYRWMNRLSLLWTNGSNSCIWPVWCDSTVCWRSHLYGYRIPVLGFVRVCTYYDYCICTISGLLW